MKSSKQLPVKEYWAGILVAECSCRLFLPAAFVHADAKNRPVKPSIQKTATCFSAMEHELYIVDWLVLFFYAGRHGLWLRSGAFYN